MVNPKSLASLFVAWAGVVCAGVQVAADAPHPALLPIVNAELARSGAPGAVAGIFTESGDPLELVVSGFRDADRLTPITRGDHFRLGSLSKVFVGQLILRLADRGQLSLSDPIDKYLADFPQGDWVTVRHCGNHTGGAFDPIWSADFQRRIMAAPDRDWSGAELIQISRRQRTGRSEIGEFQYANINSTLLGEIAERVTGQDYRELIDQWMLQPRGVTHTGFAPAELPIPAPRGYRHSPEGRWIGYGGEFTDVTFAGAGWTGAAGSMYSTLDDLARLWPELVTGRQLSPAVRPELSRWVDTGRAGEDYGFQLERRGPWLGHDGNVPGFSAAAWYHPGHDRLIIVLVNLSNDSAGQPPATTIANRWREQFETASDP